MVNTGDDDRKLRPCSTRRYCKVPCNLSDVAPGRMYLSSWQPRIVVNAVAIKSYSGTKTESTFSAMVRA